MRGFALFFTLITVAAVLAAAAVGTYHFFRRRRDHLTPPHTSYYPSPFNSGATGIQTQQVYRPPPLPLSYTQSSYQSSATYAHGQSASKTPPALPDYSRGVYHSSASSPHVRTPSQTQQPSKAPAPVGGRGVYHSSVASPHAQTLNWTQLSSTRTQPPSRVPAREPTESEPRLPTAPAVVPSGFRPEGPASVEDFEFAKKLREQARRRGREMTEAYSRAKSAQKKGLRGASQAHRQEAMAHESARKELDKQAAKIIFRENNTGKNRSDGMIDLHGLHVPEAVRLAKDQVESTRSRGDEPVRFIVGKGLHSNAGEAKIRPALEGLFNKRGLTHSLDPRNAGVLIVRPD